MAIDWASGYGVELIMPNITKAEGIESLYDFSRVESLEMLSYTR